MRIGLIRHGETDWNKQALFQGHSDIPLNRYGTEQARNTAVLLRGQPWQRLFCSPLTRTRQTANELNRVLCLGEPTVLPGVIERNFGELEGLTVFHEDGSRRDANQPSVEPAGEVLARTLASLNEVASGTGDALIVTHGTVVRLLLNKLLNVTTPSVHNLGLSIIEVDPLCPSGFRAVLANGYPVAEVLHTSV